MPDDHSEVVPLLPIPNRTVKRLCADDSADSRVKVGHRQAIKPETPSHLRGRFFCAPSMGALLEVQVLHELISTSEAKRNCTPEFDTKFKISLIFPHQAQ